MTTVDGSRKTRSIFVFRKLMLIGAAYFAIVLPTVLFAQPNIVVVMVDDLSADAFETLLSGGYVPRLEELANAGVRFQNAFVTTPQCAPSRATFLTGLYAHNHGVFANNSLNPFKAGLFWPGWLPGPGGPGHEGSTIATWLRSAGYHTGFVGKYLNGYGDIAPEGVEPTTYIPAGWDEWNGLVGDTAYRVYDYDINENGIVAHYGTSEADYQTDVLSAHAHDFVQRAVANSDPFFLFVSPLAPHIEVLDPGAILTGGNPTAGYATIRPAPRHAYLVDGDPLNGELPGLQMKPSFNELDLSDKPSCPRPPPPPGLSLVVDPFCVADAGLMSQEIIEGVETQYKGMLASTVAVDELLGTLVDELESTGAIDNTVIVFTSDNGWFYGEHRLIGKDLAYDESIRVPLIVRAPLGLAGAQASQIVLLNDLAPTLADLAGVAPSDEVDGASLAPILSDINATWHRKMFLVEHFFIPSFFRFEHPTLFALRRLQPANFTYVATHAVYSNFVTATHHELFDMNGDPYQLQSFTLPAASTQALDNLLWFYRLCRGQQCIAVESF